MSAQTCVQNLTISLGGDCDVTITPEMVALGLDPLLLANYVVRINDNSPTDSKVNQISPATGWTYGLFDISVNTAGVLVCQGTIITRDEKAPTFSPSQLAAWQLIDTVVTWADNLDEIQSEVTSQFGSTSYSTGTPGNTFARKLLFNTTANTNNARWTLGRPFMTDSCEYAGLVPGTLHIDSTWLIDADGNGNRIIAGGAGQGSPDSVGTVNGLYPNFHLSRNLQVKVTDYLVSPGCTDANGYSHVLRRSWQFIDQRGNDTTLNQIIYFQRPELRGANVDPFASTSTDSGCQY
jgi:hypothetical protein